MKKRVWWGKKGKSSLQGTCVCDPVSREWPKSLAKAVEGGDTFPEQLTEEHKLDEELHIHMHENGIAHSHGKGHRHVHSKAEKKAVLNRLSKAIGHLEAVKRMVERDADCSEVLIQLAAVRSAINNTGKVVLKNHMNHCIVEAVEENDQDAITK